MADRWLEFAGTRFLPVEQIDEFMLAVASHRRVALRLRTLEYKTVKVSLLGRFDSNYDNTAPEYKAFVHTELVCAGCGRTFPGSYTMSLLGMLSSGNVVGATAGFAEFGDTGSCPRCRGVESWLVYESFAPEEIDENDVAAIRRLWRAGARRWWVSRWWWPVRFCDHCYRRMLVGQGYLVSGVRLECARCTNETLDGGLDKLRADPYYFGNTQLRDARRLRRA